MDVIRVRFLRYSAFYAPLLLTLPRLRAAGLRPSFDIATPTRTIAAGIADGSVDVAQSALAVSFGPYARGEALPFRHFATLNHHDGFFLVGRGLDAGAGWGALRGKRVLVDHFFQPLAMFRAALSHVGLGPDAVTIVDAGDPAAMEAAFRAGEGDVLHAQGPVPHQLAAEGVGAVFASVGGAVGPVVFSTMCAAPDWLGTPAAQVFRDAFDASRAEAQAAPAVDIAAAIAAHFPGMTRDALVAAVTDYQRLGCWAGDSTITPEAYARTLALFRASGDAPVDVPMGAVVA
jgi:ABC-type nitrate/sulfonate/bicarbonate transport system substrate-binding protein